MKRMFTRNGSIFKLAVAAFAVTGILPATSKAQTYYSRFLNPAGHYSVSNPSDCGALPIQDAVSIADIDATTYAYFLANITEPYSCTDPYKFNADLNLPLGKYSVAPGQQAGFKIRVPSGITPDSLGKYLTVTTYLRDSSNPAIVTYQEYATGGSSSGLDLYGTDIDGTGKNWLIYFTATKPFNLLELGVKTGIVGLGIAYEFDTYFAFGGFAQQVLPAKIDGFKLNVSGKNVNLSWQSLTETNVSSYRIERSNGSGSYATVANIPAKGNSSTALSYAFTDKVGVDGNYLYRIVVVNKDGKTEATNSIPAAIIGQGKLILYPTVVKAGQDVTVKTSANGVVNVYLYDATGRLVKQQRTTSSGQFTIPTTGLSNGVYNVKVVSAGGDILQSKIVVN